MAAPVTKEPKQPAPAVRREAAGAQVTQSAAESKALAIQRSAGNAKANVVEEQERERWRKAMGFGREFDRLPPEEQAQLSMSPQQRAFAPSPQQWPGEAVQSAEAEQSVVESISEGAATIGSWLVGHGQWEAWQEARSSEVGARLAELATTRTKSFRDVADELDASDAPDHVAFAFMESAVANNWWLENAAKSPDGRYLLNRLYLWLIEGVPGPIQGFVRGMLPLPLIDHTKRVMKHATRIMDAFARAVPIESFAAAPSRSTKFFPFKLQGLTTFSQTPMDVRLSPEGKVLVELSPHTRGDYPEECETLPPEIFYKRVAIEPDEVIGIRLYDQGGTTIYRPAIFLLHLDQQYIQDTTQTIQLSAGLGAAVGGSPAAAAQTTRLAGVLVNLDRAVLVLGVLSKIINEHRWELEKLGFGGTLQLLDLLNSGAQIYGLGRMVMSAPQLLRSVHESYGNSRERRALMKEPLPPEQQVLLNNLDREIRNLPNPPREDAAVAAPGPAPKTSGIAAESAPAAPASPEQPQVMMDRMSPEAQKQLEGSTALGRAFQSRQGMSPEAQKQLEVSTAIAGRASKAGAPGEGVKPPPTPPDVLPPHIIEFMAQQKKSPPASAPVQPELSPPTMRSEAVPQKLPDQPSQRGVEILTIAGESVAPRPEHPTADTASPTPERTSERPGYERYANVEQELKDLQGAVDRINRKIAEDHAELASLKEKEGELRNDLKRNQNNSNVGPEQRASKQLEYDSLGERRRKLERQVEKNKNEAGQFQAKLGSLRPFRQLAPPKPGESPQQLADRWFDQLPGETLSEYDHRLASCGQDVLALVTDPQRGPEWRLVHDRWYAAQRQAQLRMEPLSVARQKYTEAMAALDKVQSAARKSIPESAIFEELRQAKVDAVVAREEINQLEYGTTTGQFAERVIRESLPERFSEARTAQKPGGQGVDLLADESLDGSAKALAAIEVKGTTGERAGGLSKAQQRDKAYVVDRLLDAQAHGSRAADEAVTKLMAEEYQKITLYKAEVTQIDLRSGQYHPREPFIPRGEMPVEEFKRFAKEWQAEPGATKFKFKAKYHLY